MPRYNKIYRSLNNERLNNDKVPKSEGMIKSCLNKMGYDTEFEAQRIASIYNQRAYKCNYCAHWHLTSAKQLRRM
jgi:hypothetical protein